MILQEDYVSRHECRSYAEAYMMVVAFVDYYNDVGFMAVCDFRLRRSITKQSR